MGVKDGGNGSAHVQLQGTPEALASHWVVLALGAVPDDAMIARSGLEIDETRFGHAALCTHV